MNNSTLLSLSPSRLRHAEFGQLITRFSEDFAALGLEPATDPGFKKIYDSIQAQIPVYNNALNQVRASEESEKIAQLDLARDAALQNLRNALKPYRNSSDEAEADAWHALSLLFAEYRNVESDTLESETNRLNTLCSRLQSPEYSAHTAVLEISKFVTRLHNTNTAFNALFSQRSFKESQKTVYDVKALRETLTADYRKIAEYTAAMATVKEDAYYKDILSVINNGRKYFSDIILARRTGSKPSKDAG